MHLNCDNRRKVKAQRERTIGEATSVSLKEGNPDLKHEDRGGQKVGSVRGPRAHCGGKMGGYFEKERKVGVARHRN